MHDQCMARNPELYTAAQVAEMYSTSADSVRRWAREGRIPVVTLPSGRVRFRREDVEKLLKAAS